MAQVFAGKRQRCIAILRECKNKWERRTPLIPSDVASLTKQGVRVIVQPSSMRIYKDIEFKQAGAELVEDVSPANTIFGVKEFPKESLLPQKSYMIFSHTIKAQEYNMPFLDQCIQQKVRLFDYETIRSPPQPDGTGGQRLVAFGKFAGLAGMIDCLRGLGERLLSLGYSSPFMAVSSAYMYPDLPTAKAAVKRAGEEIAQYGLPAEIAPLRFVFTGTGNVARGAREIFELLPHKYVTPEELATLPPNPHVVYGCVVTAEHMVEHVEGKPFNKKEYYAEPQLYRPVFHERIAPHMNVLVNSMYWDTRFPRLINLAQMKAMEESYNANPRARKFFALADITCDIGGSVEFLKRPCTIDKPFFMYNALTDEVSETIDGRGVLVLGIDNLPAEFPKDASQHFSQALKPFVLPLSESDASEPFSKASSYLPPEIYNSCITADGALTPPYAYIAKMRQAQSQSQSLSAANLKQASSPAAAADSLSLDLMLEGHLFDTGFINAALDVFETEGRDFEVVQWVISPNRAQRANNVSRAVIHVTLDNADKLDRLTRAIETLAARIPAAQARLVRLTYDDATRTYSGVIDERNKTTISFAANAARSAMAGKNDGLQQPAPASTQSFTSTQALPTPSSGATAAAHPTTTPGASSSLASAASRTRSGAAVPIKRRVLVLGSGFVVGPLLERLSRRPENHITVASAAAAEAARLVKPYEGLKSASGAPRIETVHLDVTDQTRLRELIRGCDLVVSLLPASLHPEVARLAIDARKNMVTASYVSPPMRALHESAKKAGVTILNELGLDPGLDHLACMQIIDEANERGEKVVSFQSLCGGLPAPEAANNPFAYKFSWSPLGMLLATQNSALYKENGQTVQLPASDLLTSARPLDLNPAYRLEYYANRDSLGYQSVYGLNDVESMFRGTIRYAGTARLLHGYAKLGLLERHPLKQLEAGMDWQALLCSMLSTNPAGLRSAIESKLAASGFDAPQTRRVVESMEWLGLLSSSTSLVRGGLSFDSSRAYTALEFLCALMQERMSFAPGERDMVLMVHDFILQRRDGSKTWKRSSLISYGGDDATRVDNPLLVNTPGGGGRKGYSAMSRTVGIPAALGAQMLLDGKLASGQGVLVPTTRDIYEPILTELKEKEGIEFVEEEKELN